MKKTLLALAAIAASSASFAQSSVSLYGVVDASLESVKLGKGGATAQGADTTTRIASGNLVTSRIGFRGTEDIGNGLKANFVLESALAVDTGANSGGSTRFFDRNATVGLSGDFGAVRLGRDDTLIGLVAAGPLATISTYDELRLLPTRAADTYRRADNSITYTAPTFVPGLAVAVQYSLNAGTSSTAGAEAADDNRGKSYGVSANYAAGALSAGVGYLYIKDANLTSATDADRKANATLAYAAYDFGAAKVTGYYDTESDPNNAGGRRLQVVGARVAVPVSPQFTVTVGGATARNTAGRASGDDNAHVFSLRGVYALSKRTSVYGLFTNVNNGDYNRSTVGSSNGLALTPASTSAGPVQAGETSRGLAVGVVHRF